MDNPVLHFAVRSLPYLYDMVMDVEGVVRPGG